MRLTIAVLLVCSIGITPGCAIHSPQTSGVPSAGALSRFDQSAFETLVTVQAAIETASSHIGDYPQFKPQLNQVITGYNVTMTAYKAFHVSGGVTGSEADLTQRIADLTRSVAEVIRLLKPAGPAAPPGDVPALAPVR